MHLAAFVSYRCYGGCQRDKLYDSRSRVRPRCRVTRYKNNSGCFNERKRRISRYFEATQRQTRLLIYPISLSLPCLHYGQVKLRLIATRVRSPVLTVHGTSLARIFLVSENRYRTSALSRALPWFAVRLEFQLDWNGFFCCVFFFFFNVRSIIVIRPGSFSTETVATT